MKLISFSVIFFLPIKSSVSFMTETEWNLSFDIMQTFEIRHCLILQNVIQPQKDFAAKKLSLKHIYSTTFAHSQAIDYICETEDVYANTGIIVKIKDLLILENLLRNVKKVCNSQNNFFFVSLEKVIFFFFKLKNLRYKICRYKWLIFTEDISRDMELSIRFDCEMIIIQKDNENGYTLSEICNTENKNFFSGLGKWDYNDGLEINNDFLFLRKRDFDGFYVNILVRYFNFLTSSREVRI